jgi:hypothetical protein
MKYELEKLSANLNFTIRGIEDHLQTDTPDSEAIIDALLNISEQLNEILEREEN